MIMIVRMDSLEDDSPFETLKALFFGVLGGCLLSVPFYSMISGQDWSWAQGFPISRLAAGMSIIHTYIHEFGHTIAFWFYGYVAVPQLDFQYGGGVTPVLTGQMIFLHLLLYAGLAYLYYLADGYPKWRAAFVAIGLFHLATAHFEIHQTICTFAGHLAEVTAVGLCLASGLLNFGLHGLAKRAFIIAIGAYNSSVIFLCGYGLLFNSAWRHQYYNAKGQHAIGDLDRVAEALNLPFGLIVLFWMFLNCVAIALPVILYLWVNRPQSRLPLFNGKENSNGII